MLIFLQTAGIMLFSGELAIPAAGWPANDGIRLSTPEPGVLGIDFIAKKGWPEGRHEVPGGLAAYDTLSFEAKVSGLKSFSLILYAKGGRDIISAADLYSKPELPQNEWVKIVWHFKKKAGWITPPRSTPYPFDKVNALGFCAAASKTGARQFLQVRNLRFTSENLAESESEKAVRQFIADHRPGTPRGKKLLIWAATGVRTKYTVDNTAEDVIAALPEYRKYAVDGVVMDVLPMPFRDNFFTPAPMDKAGLDRVTELVKKADWGTLRNNFFRVDIVGMDRWKNTDGSPKALDWFDDALFEKSIWPKWTYFAAKAKEVGFGMCFDNESYMTQPYNYYEKYRASGRSFAEYEAKVRQRGREFAEALAKGAPDLQVMMLFASWVPRREKEYDVYGLLPAFVDGMCEAKTSLRLIDGYEGGYEFTGRESVLRGLYDIQRRAPAASLIPELYRKRMEPAFGIWLRPEVLSAGSFAELVRNSLSESGKYVWIYTENAPLTRPEVRQYLETMTKQRSSWK